MFNRQNLLIVLVAVIGAALGLFASTQFNKPVDRPVPPGITLLKPGDSRLNLDLTDLAGKPRRLSEWDGKLVLVNFWASWCGPCRDEMPMLDTIRTKYAGKGLEIVGIAIDDAAPVKDFLKDSPVNYPIMLASQDGPDPSVRFGDTRGVLPYSVLIGRDGKVLAQRAGNFNERGLASWLEPHL